MRLNIHIKTDHIEEMSGRDLKKLIRALEITVETATKKHPKIEMNVRHNTTEAIPQPGTKW